MTLCVSSIGPTDKQNYGQKKINDGMHAGEASNFKNFEW